MLVQIMKRQLSEILDPNQFVRFWDAVDKINAALDESADLAGPVLEFTRLQHLQTSVRPNEFSRRRELHEKARIGRKASKKKAKK